MAIVTSHYQTQFSRPEDHPSARFDDAEHVATLFSDSSEWLPGDFEGPPCQIRHLDEVWVHSRGRVVATWGQDERIMSDVYAIVAYAAVWDGRDGFVTVRCGDSEFGNRHADAVGMPSVEVDAPEWLASYYECWKALREAERREAERKAHAEACRKRAEEQAKEPRKGRTCRVVRGRKVPIGTVGVCVWLGHGHYGPRVGIKDASGTVHWTAANNVEAVAT